MAPGSAVPLNGNSQVGFVAEGGEGWVFSGLSANGIGGSVAGRFGLAPRAVAQDGSGAVLQMMRDKAMRVVDVADFCQGIDALTAAGAASLDETAQFANAIAAAAAKSATLNLGFLKVLTGSQTIPSGVSIRGAAYPCLRTDSYYNQPSQIRLKPSATLSVSTGAALERLTILPAGLTFPTAATAHDEATLENFVATFAGTAITFAANANDCLFRDLGIYGFATAISADIEYGGRFFFEDIRIDCANGIVLTGGADVSYFAHVHCWPFTTAAYAAGGSVSLTRGGTAFYLGNNANLAPSIPGGRDDWTQLNNCFSYGYGVGFTCDSASNIQFVNCQADGAAGVSSETYGFHIVNDSYQIRNFNPTIFNHSTGVYVGTVVTAQDGLNPRSYEQGGGYIGCTDFAIDVEAGNVFIYGKPHFTGGGVAVQIGAGAGYFDIDFGQVDVYVMMAIHPAWSLYGSVTYPTIINANPFTTFEAIGGGAISAAQQNSITAKGALPVLGAVNDVSLRPYEIRSGSPEFILYNTAAANPATATFDIVGGTDGTMSLRSLNAARSAALIFIQLTETGPVFPGLPVAASDSAAAALSPPVPVGGLYKTSAGVVMQRTS